MDAVRRDSVQRLGRMRLLVSAIAGRAMEVGTAAPGEGAWTDGRTVFIDAGATASDQLQALSVQASLLAAGSLEPEVVRRMSGRPELARRYLGLEGHRALAANEELLPRPVVSVIDRIVVARVDSPMASLAVALGREPVDDAPRAFGVIRPRRLLASRDTFPAATPTSEHLRRRSSDDVRHEPDEEDGTEGFGQIPELFSSPGSRQGALGRFLQRMVGLRHERASSPWGPEAPAVARLATRKQRGAMLATGTAGPLEGVPVVERHRTTYPEWDVNRQCYRPGWCTVEVVDPRPEDLAPLTPPDPTPLRRPLARLGLGLERCHRQLQGDDLDIDAAVEARIDGLAGTPPDEAVYIESLPRRRDLAVLVLLDISGSSAESSNAGVTVHDQQRAAAAALTMALYGLGDRVALFAFYSKGRSAVHLVRVKSFDDDLDSLVMRRLGGLVPGAYTRLGAAIRRGASILEDRAGTPWRLLVVVSDGFAYDHGYEGRYAEADARRALAEARRRGTGCLCLNIGAGTDLAALRRVFGTAAHATVKTPDQLSDVIGPLFRAALRSAELRRRVTVRKVRTSERLRIESRTA